MLIMENSEEVLQILERFTKLKQKDIPKELEDYLCYVAKTGDTVYRWSNVKYLFREKLVHVIKDFHDTTPSIDDLPQYPNVDPFNYETMKSSLLERLEMFNSAPFTVQRLCELLTDPRKQYSRIDKFMRALEKNILVVSTVEPGRKQPESENGDSLDSVVNGDLSLDVNVDIDMESESIFGIEPHNTTSSTVTVATVAPSSSSSSSSPSSSSSSAAGAAVTAATYTKSDADDSEASLPKKAKLDVIDDSTETKTKSDSESESETSDDSDSSDSKETASKDETDNVSNKIDVCDMNQTITSTSPEKKTNCGKENQSELKIEKVESISRISETCIETEDRHKEASSLRSEMDSEKSDKDTENEPDNPAISSDSITITSVLENVESEQKNSEESKQGEVEVDLSLGELTSTGNQKESTKPDSTESCDDGSNKTESEIKVSNDEVQQSEDYEQVSDIPSNISSNLINENQTRESSEVNVNEADTAPEQIQKDNSNINLIYPECSSEASSTTLPSSNVDVMASKISSEQMSVEDQSPSTTLLLSQIQQKPQQTPNIAAITTTNEISNNDSVSSSSSSAINIATESQQILPDQPMDDNLDVCSTIPTLGNSNNEVTDPNGGLIDEVVMQSTETEQMATDTMKTVDDKIDLLSGMDVDDTSQEEAMDQ